MTIWIVLPAAFALDMILGDPRFLPHPIRWMGSAIFRLEPAFRKLPLKPVLSGALFSVFLITGTLTIAAVIVAVAYRIDHTLGTCIEVVLIYYCISVRSLASSTEDVGDALKRDRLAEAKKKVALIVGRDVDNLDKMGVARASVETIAENLVDGVVSPLFFAILGGAPLALAYKMVNTLDSMIGYKNETYHRFGKAAARIDDVANFIPARVSVFIISLAAHILAHRGLQAFRTAMAEGANHSSPNAGYPEAAFAGALAVKLGGPNTYNSVLVSKPYIGSRFGDVESVHINKACDLMILSSLLTVVLLLGIWVFL